MFAFGSGIARENKTGWPLGGVGGIQIGQARRNYLVAHRQTPAGLINEHEGVDAKIVLLGKAWGISEAVANAGPIAGCAASNLSSGIGWDRL